MFGAYKNAWKIPELRKKIIFTIIMLIAFRIGATIPVPQISKEVLSQMVKANNLLGLFDVFSGGAFAKASLFAMSITPYINASIILQLLTMAIPSFERLAKEGEEGRKIIAQYTRYGAIVLGLIQATGMYFGFHSAILNRGVLSFLAIVFTFTAGTALLMWIGEKITENGVGNGISLIIFAGIVSRMPVAAYSLWATNNGSTTGYVKIATILLIVIATVVGVVLINDGERRITVQYAKRVVGRKMYGGQSTHIPIKINMAGVIPIIFAMSIMAFPQTITALFRLDQTGGIWATTLKFFRPDGIVYNIMYALLIIFFTYFYTLIMFNPVDVANNMKKNGGFIPGIRPGKATSDYLTRVVNRTTLAGSFFLAFVAILPVLLNIVLNIKGLWFGGTALLIVVGVAIETNNQIQSQIMMRHYKGFLQ